jgi:glycerol transport system ATP-binding protein
MACIQLKEISHSYLNRPKSASDYAIKRVDHIWQDGGAYALLGPSGCGKTTLLNIISGLIQPSTGRVLYDGKDVTALQPEQRNIAQVFQFPVLYDTMSVYENLAFPLRNRGVEKREITKRVNEVAELLELSSLFHKKAAGLTADAKQKISLGRGLVRSDVAAILFDEPLTVIDPHMKWVLRRKLKEIHEQRRLTFIYVTHDQMEALTFADKVVVMVEGQILQIGTPQDLVENPEHTFVGYFIDSPGMNFLDCALDGHNAVVNGVRIELDLQFAKNRDLGQKELKLGIRPNHVELKSKQESNSAPVRIKSVQDVGSHRIVTLKFSDMTLCAKLPEKTPIPDGNAWAVFPKQWLRLYADGWLITDNGSADG